MANQRVLVAFLSQQGKNRLEQANLKSKDANPNNQLIGKLRDEHKMFVQAAGLIEGLGHAEFGVAETQRSEEFDRQRMSTNKVLTPRDTPLTEGGEPSLANATIEAPKVSMTVNGKRIGRPPKMTMRQIEEMKQSGPAVVKHERPVEPI